MKLREPDCKLGSLFFDLLRVGTSFIKSAGLLFTRGGNCILFLLRFVGCAVGFVYHVPLAQDRLGTQGIRRRLRRLYRGDQNLLF